MGAQPDIARVHWATPVRRAFVAHFSNASKAEVDLRPQIRKYHLRIRDQGQRSDCTVFATTFLIEYAKSSSTKPKPNELSEDYLNWAGNQALGTANDGGFFTEFISGFDGYGISGARAMPDKPVYSASYVPKAKVVSRAEAMFVPRYPIDIVKVWDDQTGMTAAELASVLGYLRAGVPVASGFWWLNTFQTETIDGIPLLKDYPRTPSAPLTDGHTIDLVGFHQSSAFPGGGYFIFRNSWGTGFGDKGYGFMSFEYFLTWGNDGIVIPPRPWPPAPLPTRPIIPHGSALPM